MHIDSYGCIVATFVRARARICEIRWTLGAEDGRPVADCAGVWRAVATICGPFNEDNGQICFAALLSRCLAVLLPGFAVLLPRSLAALPCFLAFLLPCWPSAGLLPCFAAFGGLAVLLPWLPACLALRLCCLAALLQN